MNEVKTCPVVDQIGVPALLEQMAEECCELAQACLKMSRKLRDENPTPKSIEDVRDNLVEELADVEVCRVYLADCGVVEIREVFPIMYEKEKRWEKRLGLHMDLEEDDGEETQQEG